jgi:cytochrome c biogenesis protein CcdA
VRASLLRTTVAYLAALIVSYLAVALAVFVFGLGPEDLRPLELVGGLVLVGVGLSVLRGSPLGQRLETALARVLVAVVPGFRTYVRPAEADVSLDGGASSAMGASLAMVCSVSGAPTLSTTMLLPLLVYAGLSSPLWIFGILLAYLLVCAVPFFLVTLGWGEALASASLRLRGNLLAANALVVIGLGIVLVLSPSAVAGAVSAPVRLLLVPLGWLL